MDEILVVLSREYATQNMTQKRAIASAYCGLTRAHLHYVDTTTGGRWSVTPSAGQKPTARRVVDLALNGSGIRDTARVLRISPTTVIAILQKAAVLHAVNPTLLPPPCSRALSVPVGRAAGLDEMWSFVGTKATARWLWHAIDHHTRRVLAYVVGTRKEAVFLKLQALLAPFGITHDYTDKAGVYVISRLQRFSLE